MAQHDYSIANQGFPATRADINNVLSAIATNNSGTSAPSTQYAGQFWIDTTSSTWTLYIHDGADDIQFATIDTSANTVNFIDSELADGSVTNAKLGADAVDGTKIADDSIDSEHYVDGSIDTAHIANDAVDSTKLDLSDDYTFTGKITGQNYPAFEAKLSSSQTVGTNGGRNKILFNEEVFDTDNCYDHTTNYRFTPNVAGKYFCHFSVRAGESNSSALQEASAQIRFNGASGIYENYWNLVANNGKTMTPTIVTILEFNGTTDYIEAYAFYESTAFGGTETFSVTGTFFGAYRIGD